MDEALIKKWLRRLLNVVLYLTIAFACCLMVIAVLSDRDQPLWGLNTYVVTSGSMEPAIGTGSLIIARNTEASAVQVGDIITYKNGDELIAHRVIEVRNNGTLVTQGDANEIADAAVAAENVSGKVVLTLPYLGTLTGFVHSSVGYIFLIVVPAVLLLGMFLWDVWIGNDKKHATMVAPLLVLALFLCAFHIPVAQAYYATKSDSAGVSISSAEEFPILEEEEIAPLALGVGVDDPEGDGEATEGTTTTVDPATTTTSTTVPEEETGDGGTTTTEAGSVETSTTTTTTEAVATTTTTTTEAAATTTTTTTEAAATTTTTAAPTP